LAVAGQFAYSLTSIYNDYLHQEGALVIFGKEVMEKMQNGERVLYIQKASAFDTGIVLYAESDRILKEAELAEKWKSNVVANVIVNEDGLRLLNEAGLYPVPVLTSDNERSTEQVHYLLQQPAHL
jgi:hypothetical protein